MFRDDRKKIVLVVLELQEMLQKTYSDMDNSSERAVGIYRGESIGYKTAIGKLIEEFKITREELSLARKKREDERAN